VGATFKAETIATVGFRQPKRVEVWTDDGINIRKHYQNQDHEQKLEASDFIFKEPTISNVVIIFDGSVLQGCLSSRNLNLR
jgi:hypothetical protein